MMKIGRYLRLSNPQPSSATIQRIAGSMGVVLLLMAAAGASAQLPAPGTPMAVPEGYTSHESVDVGGHIVSLKGSQAMYDTLVNLQSGPRALGESFEMHALPTNKHTLVDSLSAIGNGFGGDPNNFARLDMQKGRIYQFTGVFRRDRQYFDYDLLGNPNITTGLSIPVSGSTTPLAWPQVNQSPVMFNTVRRMTDTTLTLYPLATWTVRAGYSQNIFQGPTLSPGESVGKYDSLLQEFQRNSTDDFTIGVDWKPRQGTKLTFEEQIDHYKGDSYFTLAPGELMVQEANGLPVSMGNWDSLTPYSNSGCNKTSMANQNIILYANPSGARPIIDPACDVVSSYLRSQPTRILYPTEILRMQSNSIKNISMNGDFRYSRSNMNLPNYYENVQGLDGAIRSITFTGNASARREVMAADYGILWQATKILSLADQFDYTDVHQPGTANISAGATQVEPATAPGETINYSGTLTAGSNVNVGGSPNGTALPNYFGQKNWTNNLTGSVDVGARTTVSLTFRYGERMVAQGIPASAPMAPTATNGTITIDETGGIFNIAVRPAHNWNVNGTVEALYDDNAFTPVGARQTRHYKVHTVYRPKPWATISGAYNDLERHNNTNNNQADVAAAAAASTPTSLPNEGPLGHVDYSRVGSVAVALEPSEHYGLDLDYSYSDVYSATNICYDSGAQNAATVAGLVGAASKNSSGGPNVCLGVFTRGSTTQLADWFAKDFMDAPTQSGSMALVISPIDKIRTTFGYRVSSVNGTQFFNDARAVNGSLVSTYQTPYANIAYTVRKGWIVKLEYNYTSYGEGGPSGAAFCSTSTSLTSTVIPCTSATTTVGLTEPNSGLSAPRVFRANNVSLGMHYEF
jgi:hypothetical protein